MFKKHALPFSETALNSGLALLVSLWSVKCVCVCLVSCLNSKASEPQIKQRFGVTEDHNEPRQQVWSQTEPHANTGEESAGRRDVLRFLIFRPECVCVCVCVNSGA